MAQKVNAQVHGGTTKTLDDVDTVQDVIDALGLSGTYTANVNGEPAALDEEVPDFAYVSLSAAVKGGRA